MKFKVLKTEKAYNIAIYRIEELFNAKPGSEAFDELELLSLLVKDYEDRHYPMPEPDPIAVIKLKMDEIGLKNKDLIPVVGSESHVSSILSGRRKLTLDMARSLAIFLDLPARVFINDRYSLEHYAPAITSSATPPVLGAALKLTVYADRAEKKPKKFREAR
ncbi:transcriptional regulator [Pedobacter heparinus]|uniref:helix-turn-helix domain-containing protein n=1 Tax=Pedobacter heparinus TaxID=984 RepID=UPI0029315C6B|nr:transcriptional regulator [Pedobacter heparinus]